MSAPVSAIPVSATSVPTAKPEFEFLCCIARPRPTLDRARALLAAGLDFDELLRLAAQHAIRPLLLKGFAALDWQDVPAAARRSLEGFAHGHLMRSLSFAEEICRVSQALHAAGIPFAAFKGVVLAAALYGDPAGREYLDIDIVVPADRVRAAEDTLATLGYHGHQGDRAFRHTFLSYLRQFALVSQDDRFAIDLHWGFSGAYVPFPLAPEDIWNDLAALEFGGRPVPVLSDADLALLLAGHGTKEQWRTLGWIEDFALLIERRTALDWVAIHRRAEARGCGGSVTLGALLARDLLGAELPPALASLAAADKRSARRAASLIARLELGLPEPESLPNFSDLDLCDRQLDRVKAVLELAFTPTTGDYSAMPLPPALWSLYRLTRPFRLAAKAARLR